MPSNKRNWSSCLFIGGAIGMAIISVCGKRCSEAAAWIMSAMWCIVSIIDCHFADDMEKKANDAIEIAKRAIEDMKIASEHRSERDDG